MPSADILLLGPAWTAATAILVFMMGACAGSFINCLAWRLMNGESVVKGRSHCVSCGHELGALDLIPVFSWLLLRGKCRHCGVPVAFRYMAAELVSGLYFLSIAWFYGASVHCLLLWVLGCILLGLSLCDLESFIIPNGFILAGLAVWVLDVVCSMVFPWENLAVDCFPILFGSFIHPEWLAIAVEACIAAVFICVFMLALTALVSKRKGIDSMGGGDLKLFFVVSLFLGLCGAFFNIIASCVIGLILGTLFRADDSKDKELVALVDETEAAQVVALRELNLQEEGNLPGAQKPRATCVKEFEASLNDPEQKFKYRPPKGAFPLGPAIALGTWFTLLVGPAAVNAYMGLIFS